MLMLKNNPIFFIYVYKSCNFLWADNLMMSSPVYIGLFHIEGAEAETLKMFNTILKH